MKWYLHIPYILLHECAQALCATSALPSGKKVRSVEFPDIYDINFTHRKSLLDGLKFIWRVIPDTQVIYTADDSKLTTQKWYEGWNFNFGNAAVTFETAHLQSSYFHRPSMYSPKLCRTCSQWWGSRMMPLAAPVLLMVQTERSTVEGLNPPCNCPIR